ncbi:MAG: TAT-variant-translocated molybdopterin oxidoreductase [Acidobacteriota bacterium]
MELPDGLPALSEAPIPGLGPEPAASGPIDLAAVREHLGAQDRQGAPLWRSLDELAATPTFQDWLHREFPRQASEWLENPADGLSRRNFLQLSGASLALAGLAGCTKQPVEKVVPYVNMPEGMIPGRPMYFATTITQGGYGVGVIAESHEGRPTKLEGNADHPSSLGSTDARTQAAIIGLYDPARSTTIRYIQQTRSWSDFTGAIVAEIRALEALQGEGLRFISGATTSPTFATQMTAILARFPQAKWHRWEPAAPHAARAAAIASFGSPQETVYDFTKAKVVLSLGADFLTQGPSSIRYARDFSQGRRPRSERLEMNRYYAVESSPTASSTIADHRMILAPAELEAFALGVAAGVGAAGVSAATVPDKAKAFLDAAVADLKANAGASAVIADPYGSVEMQVLAHVINLGLGNVGQTVSYPPVLEVDPIDHVASIVELGRDLAAGRVEMLVVLGSNPVYDAPAELKFGEAIKKAKSRVHWGLHDDETGELCQWHITGTHELESWGDALAHDGTASLIQPLVEPLYGGKSAIEFLGVFQDKLEASGYDLVHETWAARLGGAGDPEKAFRKAIHDGVIPPTATTATPAGSSGAFSAAAAGTAAQAIAGRAAGTPGGKASASALPLLFRPDPTLGDGSLATNAWLQELPKPITKLVWDNGLIVSPRTAQDLGLAMEGKAEIDLAGRKLEVGVWVQPGHADGCATLHLGHGRWTAGPLGSGHGFNAYKLRGSDSLGSAVVAVKPLPGRYVFANTQNHHLLESGADEYKTATEEVKIRQPVKALTLAEFAAMHAGDHVGKKEGGHGGEEEKPATLFPQTWEYNGHAWGMSIDLSACTGCVACVIACQAENNIPIVGKEQVIKGREMHWIRIDRYFAGDLDDPQLMNQPVPCMQCEQAPCEVVCPVAATVHSEEGLNDMVYNRCVGTRYCSNNCPYKVRRFNFLRYSNHDVPVLKLAMNPDVTVRMRGVMEKCTYCVQRIHEVRIDARVAQRPIKPGEIVTACQQACPTEAIVFGDQNDPAWAVTREKAQPSGYTLLEELNTRPRTTYLAKITNPNPQLSSAERS